MPKIIATTIDSFILFSFDNTKYITTSDSSAGICWFVSTEFKYIGYKYNKYINDIILAVVSLNNFLDIK